MIILSIIYPIGFVITMWFVIEVNLEAGYKMKIGDYAAAFLWPLFWGLCIAYIIIDKIKP